jgi:hypothetical protein
MDYQAPGQNNKESSQKGYPANPEKFLPSAFPDHKRHNRYYWYRKSKESLGKERETAEDSENQQKAIFFPSLFLTMGKKEGNHRPSQKQGKYAI